MLTNAVRLIGNLHMQRLNSCCSSPVCHCVVSVAQPQHMTYTTTCPSDIALIALMLGLQWKASAVNLLKGVNIQYTKFNILNMVNTNHWLPFAALTTSVAAQLLDLQCPGAGPQKSPQSLDQGSPSQPTLHQYCIRCDLTMPVHPTLHSMHSVLH